MNNTQTFKREDIVEAAKSCLDVKYKDNSSSKERGMDCLGLITYCCKQVGLFIPEFNYDIQVDKIAMVDRHIKDIAVEIDEKEIKPGSFILFRSTVTRPIFYHHFAIFIGSISINGRVIENTIIHGYKSASKIVMSDYFSPWRRFFYKAYDLKGFID